MSRDIAVGVDDSLVAPQLDNLPDDHDIAADIVVQIWSGDAGGRSSLHLYLSLI
jgi:hypothetical protein